MRALALAALASALLLVPRGVAVAERKDGGARRGGVLAGRVGVRAAGACVAVAALVGFGPLRGAFVAAVLAPLTAIALRALQSRPPPRRADRSLALTLDLCAAALRAGRTPADAVSAAAPAADPPTAAALLRVAGLLRLGADPVRAWAVLAADGPLAALASTAARSATSGIRSAAAFERLAADIRADCAAAATARAQRAGVLAIAPLAACFLPAFVCLGVVPVVVGVAQSALGVLR